MAAAIPVGIAHVSGKWMGVLFPQSNQGIVLFPTLSVTLAREVQQQGSVRSGLLGQPDVNGRVHPAGLETPAES